eukprot:g1341.t1
MVAEHFADTLLDFNEWESWVVAICSIVSSLASLITILSFKTFPFLRTYPRNLVLYFTIVDFFAGVLICISFVTPSLGCFEHYLVVSVFVHVYFAEFLWLACISHAIFEELRDKKLSFWIMRHPAEAAEKGLLVSRSEKERRKINRVRLYHVVCWGLPVIYWALMIGLIDLCSNSSLDDLDPALVLAPEILTLLASLVFVTLNYKLARECIDLLGLGKEGSSINSNNFTRHSVYFGMVLCFGITRLPAVVASIIRIYATEKGSTFQHLLLAIECILSPLQGLFLFMWLSAKLNDRRPTGSTKGTASMYAQKTMEQQITWLPEAAMLATGTETLGATGGGRQVSEKPFSLKRLLLEAGLFCAKTVFYTYLVHRLFGMAGDLIKSIDPQEDEKKKAKQMRSALEKRLLRKGRTLVGTTMHENLIAQDLVNPEDIKTAFRDIGGLAKEKREIYNLVVLPLRRPELFLGRGRLYRPPQGLLLHGLPGTGKTMLAKAIAKESGAAFINLRLSTLLNKYFGESQQLVRALFSLARKLSPTIIFIDEIDGFLRERSVEDHHCVANMKAEFMQLWDGMMTDSLLDPSEQNQFGVVIVGASNRVADIDTAILRRMPRTFAVGLPDCGGRENILRIMLKGETLSSDFDFQVLASDELTKGFSGADLKELCRAAAMRPLQDLLEREDEEGGEEKGIESKRTSAPSRSSVRFRALQLSDFVEARKDVRPPAETVLNADSSSATRFGGTESSLMHAIFHHLMQQQEQYPRDVSAARRRDQNTCSVSDADLECE